MNVMKKSITALALAGLLGLTACSADAIKSDAAVPEATPVASATKTADTSTPSPSATLSKDLQDELAAFGEEWTYKDGIAVKVTYTGPSQAGEYSAGAELTGGQIRLFDVSITNNGEAIFDPAMAYIDVNYGPQGTAAERVFDSGNGISGDFQGKILPGGNQTVTMAYAIPTDAPTDILMTVTPSWDHAEKLFHGVDVL